MKRSLYVVITTLVIILMTFSFASAASPKTMVGINVLLKTDVTEAILADLALHGSVRDVVGEIDAVTLQARSGELELIRKLPYVAAAEIDQEVNGAPIDTVLVQDFSDGRSTWDLDAINVTEYGAGRVLVFDGSGVFVAVLDTGLVDSWRQYFPEERIAEEYAISLRGGGGYNANISEPTNMWEHDQNSHGTHVTSTILGYSMYGTQINGVAPMATVIPVKVLGQNGSGWWSVISRGIIYVANLKAEGGELHDFPVVINMSLGGSIPSAMEEAAINYAIEQGVIVVASAGNRGEAGMGYPGAFPQVISAAASGWVDLFTPGSGGWLGNVPDPTNPDNFYIVDYSSRAKPGQDLDVTAPGAWVVGPYQVNSGQISYYYLGGTSMASPHVAGIVALMLDKNPALTRDEVEGILEGSAIFIGAGCRDVLEPAGYTTYCWDTDATGAGLVSAKAALKATPK